MTDVSMDTNARKQGISRVCESEKRDMQIKSNEDGGG